jgi:uncharacterized membrane protein YdfJ with MMPL/SSD domain
VGCIFNFAGLIITLLCIIIISQILTKIPDETQIPNFNDKNETYPRMTEKLDILGWSYVKRAPQI